MTILLLAALAVSNLQLTPGVVRPLTKAQICSTVWGKDHRHVTEAMKREVARRYGIKREDIKARGKGPCCEIDHKIPRELGGADHVDNLSPQPWLEAHEKDIRENQLHVAVCRGDVTLAAAQEEMRQWGRAQGEKR